MIHKKNILLIHTLPKETESLLMLIIIALTGFSSFFSIKSGIYLIALFILSFALKKKQEIGKIGIISISIIILAFILQQFKLHGSISLVVTQFIKYLTLFYCAVLLRPQFKQTFIRVLYILSIISLTLYILSIIPFFRDVLISIGNFLPELRDREFLLSSTNPSISLYIYTLPVDSYRNCGPFWEPGMFVVFLILALGLNLFGKNTKLLSKTNLVFIISLITTFSTTGYICLAFIIFSYIYFKNQSIGLKLACILILPILLTELSQLDFMTEKIQEDMANSDLSYSRFGAIFYHLEKIELNPWFGYGINEWPFTSMDMVLPEDGSVSPNGWSIIAVYWGIPLTIFYFIFLYLGLKDILDAGKTQTVIFFISVMLSVFSQDITNRLLFYVIDFIGILHLIPYQVVSKRKIISNKLAL